MLEHLDIKNFALIDKLSIDFTSGFNVLTGETGAGKSIILNAVSLLLGEKTEKKIIRKGSDECMVNAIFSVPKNHEIIAYLKENSLEPEDGNIYIKRIVKAKEASRDKITIQDQVVSRNQLAFIANSLLDMHFQTEHQSLLLNDRQRKILDSYSNNENQITAYREVYQKLESLKQNKLNIEKDIEESKREKDYLSFIVEEINKVNPKLGEDEKLSDEIKVLNNYESIFSNLEVVVQNLKVSKDNLYDGEQYLQAASKNDKGLIDLVTRLESNRLETEDIYENIREKFSSFNFSSEHLDNLQDRYSKIQRLKKYGKTLEKILDYRDETARKLDNLENSAENLNKIDNQINLLTQDLMEKGTVLSNKRKQAALKLSKRIEEKLKMLAMPHVKFVISVEDCEPSPYGKDEINFLLCPNVGEELKPLNQIASGGELSRVMLALKTALSDIDEVQTQIFDEVDTGIGGVVAKAVANQMRELSKNRQVIAITHLAVIASQADTQFVVSKYEEDGRTYSTINKVSGKDRVEEIARMLSGQINEVSIKHASSLLR